MNTGASFKRILLKLSGEALKGEQEHGLDPEAVDSVCGQISELIRTGIEVAVVVGAGNIFRGLPASEKGVRRNTADYMGMMATVINGLGLQDGLEKLDMPASVVTPFGIQGVTQTFDHREVDEQLKSGSVIIFAGGTGHPFFTTDTTAALRSCEIQADALLKATKVDGVYSADPKTTADAVRYKTLSYADALQQQLKVMDATAFSLCRENDVPIIVFNFSEPEILQQICSGDLTQATVVSNDATVKG